GAGRWARSCVESSCFLPGTSQPASHRGSHCARSELAGTRAAESFVSSFLREDVRANGNAVDHDEGRSKRAAHERWSEGNQQRHAKHRLRHRWRESRIEGGQSCPARAQDLAGTRVPTVAQPKVGPHGTKACASSVLLVLGPYRPIPTPSWSEFSGVRGNISRRVCTGCNGGLRDKG